jgi:sterol desaturase/sphingolipid hydroxylase (fatty acid hydroxylase superfamily)/uncharacterized membrane protein YhhN
VSQVIVLATPVFLALIALEWAWSHGTRARVPARRAYRLNDTISSISLGIISQLTGVMAKVLTVGIYTAVFHRVAVLPDLTLWTTWVGCLLALVLYDFCYYWLHRAGHEVALLWAAHAVHHQSQHYNLSTALRQTSSGALFGWIFYVPMAVVGVPPMVFGIVALVDLLYQFWVHTEQVGKLGWFDRVFCSPSNHRVHHAMNDLYIDRNYGGILVVWDRLFGTFQEELDHTPCVYGTRTPLNSWDPVWANLAGYWALLHTSLATRHWHDWLRVWFKPPGWQPPDVHRSPSKPAFALDSVTTYNPALSRARQCLAAVQFGTLLGAVAVFLWHADAMPTTDAALWVAALSASLWAVGLLMQGRLAGLEVLVLECAALATLASLGLLPGYFIFKPGVMAIAIIFVAARAIKSRAKGQFDVFLAAALLLSLCGDVFLMLPGDTFIPGLASFLVAHLFYIALFRQGQAWFPSRIAVAVVLIAGASVVTMLWSGLATPVLKGAVTAYVVVISLMAAQALGRASSLGTPQARWVAAGACVFMLSDTLIAVNKFLAPVPLASLWVLTTYYTAQMLMVHFARPADVNLHHRTPQE